MSDYFSKFEAELRSALRQLDSREPSRPRGRSAWRRPTPLVVALLAALVAVPALAAVTGAFKTAHVPRHLRPGTGASLEPPCTPQVRQPAATTIAGPAPAAFNRYFAALRRPQQASDRLARDKFPPLSGIYTEGIRLTYDDGQGTKYYLVPSANMLGGPAVPDTPACATYRRLANRHRAGICVVAVGRVATNGGEACAALKSLASHPVGLSQGFSYEMAQGTMRVAGLIVDGYSTVILDYPARAPVHEVRVPVHGNFFATTTKGRPEVFPKIYGAGPNGIRLLDAGPPKTSARQRAMNHRSAARDRTAGATPTVIPPIGRPHTTFTMRVRVEPMKGYAYVVSGAGPPGPCAHPIHTFAYSPEASGPERGLIKVGIGYGPLGLHKMCIGKYHGEIRRVRAGAPATSGPIVGRFEFEVRPGSARK